MSHRSLANRRNLMERARELRAEGWTYTEIALELDVSQSTTHRWLDPRNESSGGICECGCGGATTVDISRWRPYRFIFGHHQTPDMSKDYLVAEDGCWVWQLARTKKGYGIANRDGTQIAHRWYYTKLVGPIPGGLTIDHLCMNKACVNPEHMEPVTAAENTRRAARHRREARCSN